MITYEQWEDYLKRSKDPYGKFYPAQNILSDDRHGFVTYDIIDDYILIHQMYGNGKHWIAHVKAVAKQRKLSSIRWFTKRNPQAIEKRYGAKIEGYIMSMEA